MIPRTDRVYAVVSNGEPIAFFLTSDEAYVMSITVPGLKYEAWYATNVDLEALFESVDSPLLEPDPEP